MCQLFGSIFALWTLSIICQKYIFTMLAYSMSNIWHTPFVCMCLFCVVLVVVFENWVLNCVMVPQRYMLGLLCDVTSIVSFSHLSGCVFTDESMCILHMLCIGLLHIWQCEIIAFLHHLWLIFCPCYVLSLFHVQISPLGNQYTDST